MPIFCLFGLFDRQQIAVHDADVSHAHAADFEQVIRLPLEQTAFQIIGMFNVLLRQNGATRSNPTYQWQGELSQALQGQRKLFVAKFVQRSKGIAAQAYAT